MAKLIRLHHKKVLLVAAVSLVCIGLVVLTFQRQKNASNTAVPKQSLIDSTVLDLLATKKTDIDLSHVSDTSIPPTNKWFSGFALQKKPEPGFFYPGSFRPTPSGFELSLPTQNTTEKVVLAPHSPDLVVTIDSTESYKITAYDELTVTLTYFKGSEPIADIRIGAGLPYVYVTARNKNIGVSYMGTSTKRDSGTSISAANKTFGVNVKATENRFVLGGSKTATFFVMPKTTDFATMLRHASARVDSAVVSYVVEDDSVTTMFTYKTADKQPTMFVRLPHQLPLNDAKNAEYESVLGSLYLETGTQFSYTTPLIKAQQSLALAKLSKDAKNVIGDQLVKDVATLPPTPDDTYFGGKQLQRTAQLLDIAAQLGDQASKQKLLQRLSADMTEWLAPGKTGAKSFQYVQDVQGIVGTNASFGSDTQFNDHHFHYGYFLNAAAMLAMYDDKFIEDHGKMINLLAADIANYNDDEKLPLRRNYDPYAGHSWASGTSPFADGNNQESTSEAINAWSGLAAWATVTKNSALQHEADWMLSNEYATAQRYWLLRNGGKEDMPKEYMSPIVSLLWGGKREYATFFSDEANAKLAIQLLPVTPTLQSAGLELTPAELKGTDVAKQYGDAILMVSPDATLEKAKALPDTAIDDGNSRTYMYAYILTRKR